MKQTPAKRTHDPQLLADCLAGDRKAQEAFYRRYAPPALQLIRRYTRSREEAMEILNSGMLRVFQKLELYKGTGSLEGWIKRVVFRVAADHFRAKRQPATLQIADWDQPVHSNVTHELFAQDLCRIIDALPGISREIFWLHAVEGYSHAEISNHLGLNESTCRWHLSKARSQLKKTLATSAYKTNRHAG